jgi:hypothetical protein
MEEEMRLVVLGEMHSAGQLATLAGCGIDDIRRDLDQRVAYGRILSVRHEGVVGMGKTGPSEKLEEQTQFGWMTPLPSFCHERIESFSLCVKGRSFKSLDNGTANVG